MRKKNYLVVCKHATYGEWYFTSLHKACKTLELAYCNILNKLNNDEIICINGWHIMNVDNEQCIGNKFINAPKELIFNNIKHYFSVSINNKHDFLTTSIVQMAVLHMLGMKNKQYDFYHHANCFGDEINIESDNVDLLYYMKGLIKYYSNYYGVSVNKNINFIYITKRDEYDGKYIKTYYDQTNYNDKMPTEYVFSKYTERWDTPGKISYIENDKKINILF